MADPKVKITADTGGKLNLPVSERPTGTQPLIATMPTAAELVGLTNDELLELLHDFGVVAPWPQLVADTYGYATEMSKITNVGTPGMIEREVQRLLEPKNDSRRALLGLARETQRAFNMDAFAKEGPNQEYIRISEDDEHTCERCDALAGTIGTMGEHVSMGLPGPASCDGGSYCRCVLVLID